MRKELNFWILFPMLELFFWWQCSMPLLLLWTHSEKKLWSCGTWVLLRNTQWVRRFMTRVSSQGLRQKSVSFLICVDTWTIVQDAQSIWNFLILLWMCRNNSHASKYCQDLQNSYISTVLSVNWARDFRFLLCCLRSLSRTGSSDPCCSKFLCHSFHIRVSPTTLCMCKLSSTQAGKNPSPVLFYVVLSKIFSRKK